MEDEVIMEIQQFYLRPFAQGDFDLLGNLWNEKSVIDMMQCKPLSEEKIAEKIDRYKSWMDNFGFTNFAVFDKASSDFVGSCGFSLFHDPDSDRNPLPVINGSEYESRDIEIGYVLREKYWGRGIAKELASACLKYLFKNRSDIKRVVAVTTLSNIASQNILENLGFDFIKIVKSKEYGEERFYSLDQSTRIR